jgi:hypothetical protein
LPLTIFFAYNGMVTIKLSMITQLSTRLIPNHFLLHVFNQLLVPVNKRYEKYINIRELTLIQNYNRTKKRGKGYGRNRM